MIINDAQITMNSKRSHSIIDEASTSVRVWINSKQTSAQDTVSISQAAKSSTESCSCGNEMEGLDPSSEFYVSIEKLIAELLSGRKVRVVRRDEVDGDDNGTDSAPQGRPGNVRGAESDRQGWGLEIDSEQVHRENEDLSFSARGIVMTSDGKEFEVSLRLDMSREYIEKNSLTIRAGDALTDPLVINLSGGPIELSGKKFAFDLDSDGKEEQISVLRPGSGFLTIDLNDDGLVNDGAELFGPNTGNGFDELEGFDSDGNKWIDENDEAYQMLSIMTFDEQGMSRVQSLKEVGIGAIYLSYSSTLFDLRQQGTNTLLGRIKGTGIYLSEQGDAGTVQQIDLVT